MWYNRKIPRKNLRWLYEETYQKTCYVELGSTDNIIRLQSERKEVKVNITTNNNA